MLKLLAVVMSSVVLSVSSMLGLVHFMPKASAEPSLIRQATWHLVGDSGACSATKIREDFVLTAAHCNQPNMTINGIKATPVKIDESVDLMLLVVPGLKGPSIPLALDNPAVDTPVSVVGYPLGIGQVVTQGAVQFFKDHSMLVSAPVVFGNSGGGAFVLVDGQWVLVGVMSAVAVAHLGGFFPNIITHLAVATNLDAVKAFL